MVIMKSVQKVIGIISIAIVSVLFFGCSSAKNDKSKVVEFRYVQPPALFTPMQGANYVARNFWKHYTPDVDSVALDKASKEFILALVSTQGSNLESSVNNAFVKADSLAVAGNKRLILKLISDAESAFYYPNSPYLNEEVYLLFLNNFLNAKGVSDLDKLAYEYHKKICSLNRWGTVAADFEFKSLSSNGKYKVSSMHSIKSEYTLLFFNNPDCRSCADILEKLKGSNVSSLVGSKRLSVLAMYIDEQIDVWSTNRELYPKEWIYAYDPNFILRDNQLYGLRAIPSIYLLDKEKRVILKDAPVEAVISYLGTI